MANSLLRLLAMSVVCVLIVGCTGFIGPTGIVPTTDAAKKDGQISDLEHTRLNPAGVAHARDVKELRVQIPDATESVKGALIELHTKLVELDNKIGVLVSFQEKFSAGYTGKNLYVAIRGGDYLMYTKYSIGVLPATGSPVVGSIETSYVIENGVRIQVLVTSSDLFGRKLEGLAKRNAVHVNERENWDNATRRGMKVREDAALLNLFLDGNILSNKTTLLYEYGGDRHFHAPILEPRLVEIELVEEDDPASDHDGWY